MKQYKYKVNGAQYDVTIDSIVGNKAKVEVNGIPFEVEMQGSSLVEADLPTQAPIEGATPAAAPATPAPAAPAPVATPAPAGSGEAITSPLPGTVLEVKVQNGQAVIKGIITGVDYCN